MSEPDRLALAVGTTIAVHKSVCGSCGKYIWPGDIIARLCDPDGWLHLKCLEVERGLQHD